MNTIILLTLIVRFAFSAETSCLYKCESNWNLCKINSTECGCLSQYDVCIRDICNADDSFIEADCLSFGCDWCQQTFGSYYLICLMIVVAFISICLFVGLICYLCKVLYNRHKGNEQIRLVDPYDKSNTNPHYSVRYE